MPVFDGNMEIYCFDLLRKNITLPSDVTNVKVKRYPVAPKESLWERPARAAWWGRLVPAGKLYDFEVAPNPSTGFVTFNFEKVQNSAIRLDIFNMLGKKVKSIQLTEAQTSIDIDLTKEQSGIYVAYLGIGKEQNQVKRFVIQK